MQPESPMNFFKLAQARRPHTINGATTAHDNSNPRRPAAIAPLLQRRKGLSRSTIMSRALLRSAWGLRTIPNAVLPLRPLAATTMTTTATITTATAAPWSRSFNSTASIIEPVPPRHPNNASNPTASEVRPLALKKSHPSAPPTPVADSVRTLLPLLSAQPGHYITVHIHGFPYLVQEGDKVRLPFRMPGVLPGDVLRLNRASVIGSRDYTMKGAPHIDERLFECRATVLGMESEPLRIKVKKKRRQRRMRQAKSKHRYTILRISDLSIKNLEDVDEPAA